MDDHPYSSEQCNPAEEELEAQLHMLLRFPAVFVSFHHMILT